MAHQYILQRVSPMYHLASGIGFSVLRPDGTEAAAFIYNKADAAQDPHLFDWCFGSFSSEQYEAIFRPLALAMLAQDGAIQSITFDLEG